MRHIRRMHEMAAFYSHKVTRLTGFPVVTNHFGWHDKSHILSSHRNGVHVFEMRHPGKKPEKILTLEITPDDEQIIIGGSMAEKLDEFRR